MRCVRFRLLSREPAREARLCHPDVAQFDPAVARPARVRGSAKADDQSLALQACQRALHRTMLGVRAKPVAVGIALDLEDVGNDCVGAWPARARILAQTDRPHARRLYPSSAMAHVNVLSVAEHSGELGNT